MSKGLSVALRLLSSENELWATFYQSVRGGARRPEDNAYDPTRERFDVALFPYYHEYIHFAALSLDGTGAFGFGACSIVLKNVSIENRATVFEKNSIDFLKGLGLTLDAPVPPGFRATWVDRDKLAAAKLEPNLTTTTTIADLPTLLLKSTPDKIGDDFIEVHIYGPLTVHSVERVLFRTPTRRADSVLIADLRRKLRPSHIPVGEY